MARCEYILPAFPVRDCWVGAGTEALVPSLSPTKQPGFQNAFLPTVPNETSILTSIFIPQFSPAFEICPN